VALLDLSGVKLQSVADQVFISCLSFVLPLRQKLIGKLIVVQAAVAAAAAAAAAVALCQRMRMLIQAASKRLDGRTFGRLRRPVELRLAR
jgi:hypothetical protein